MTDQQLERREKYEARWLPDLDVAGRRRDLRICAAYAGTDGRQDREIHPGPFGDLVAQEALTRRLLQSRPVYEENAPGADMTRVDVTVGWIDQIGSMLQAPVVLASYGPTRGDKHVVEATVLAAA